MKKIQNIVKDKNTHNLSKKGDVNIGFLSFFESQKDIPFEIKRIYYIYQVPKGTKRGMHAHKKLEQILWCPYGTIEIVLYDGEKKAKHLLDSPEKTLYVRKGLWRDMYWKKNNSVLCVAASEYYDENDYIRDYDDFIKMVKDGYWKGAKDTSKHEEKKEKIDQVLLDAFRKKHALTSQNLEDILNL